MKDRNPFQEVVLENGIRVFFCKYKAGYVYHKICIPLGSMHNCAPGVRHGTAHALEHVVCSRSKLFPQRLEIKGVRNLL
jgi:predicted Zn-dependent peptidase